MNDYDKFLNDLIKKLTEKEINIKPIGELKILNKLDLNKHMFIGINKDKNLYSFGFNPMFVSIPASKTFDDTINEIVEYIYNFSKNIEFRLTLTIPSYYDYFKIIIKNNVIVKCLNEYLPHKDKFRDTIYIVIEK